MILNRLRIPEYRHLDGSVKTLNSRGQVLPFVEHDPNWVLSCALLHRLWRGGGG